MLPFLPGFIPNLLQIAPFVLIFALACANPLRKHAGVFYAFWTLVVTAVTWHKLVLSLMQESTPAFVVTYGNMLDTVVNNSPLVSTLVTLFTSSFTGVALYLIVMFVGALDKTPLVKRLLSIRSELSVIGGIIIMGHVVRILDFFFMSLGPQWSTIWGEPAGQLMFIAAAVIGPILTLLFLIPWITSFKVVRRRMSHATWKKTQLLAYPFMAFMIAQGFFLALGHCLYGYPFDSQTFALSIMSNPVGWLESFAQQVATAWMYVVLGGAYLVLRLRKRARDKAKASATEPAPSEQLPETSAMVE